MITSRTVAIVREERLKAKNVLFPITAAVFLLFIAFPRPAVTSETEEEECADFRTMPIEMYNAGKYEDLAGLIERNCDRLPGRAMNMSYNMALVRAHLEEYKTGIEYLETELDNRIPDRRLLADLFKETGLQCRFILTPDIGHLYPEDLPEMIDRAIAHIRSG